MPSQYTRLRATLTAVMHCAAVITTTFFPCKLTAAIHRDLQLEKLQRSADCQVTRKWVPSVYCLLFGIFVCARGDMQADSPAPGRRCCAGRRSKAMSLRCSQASSPMMVQKQLKTSICAYLLCAASLLVGVHGHGYLSQPPSRNFLGSPAGGRTESQGVLTYTPHGGNGRGENGK